MLFLTMLEIFLIAAQALLFFLLPYSKTVSYSSTPFLTCEYIGKDPTNQDNNIIFKILKDQHVMPL